MANKLKEILFPTPEQTYKKYVNDFRTKNIPERYNQIKLMDELLNPELDHLVSISNRSDGKSYNYIHFLFDFSMTYKVGFTLLARNYTVRFSYQQLITKIIDKSELYDGRLLQFMRTDFYILVLYKDRQVGIITDLNQATQLKYLSNFLEDFPIMVYDEFLALEGDYLQDEWERLKTVYGSINRDNGIPVINTPKIIYLGNAVNFSSPVLSNLNLFNVLENHPINTMKQYDNIALEMNRNELANDNRNLRAFKEDRDDMTNAEFKINTHNIATGHDRDAIKRNARYITVKLREDYLKIMYNPDTMVILLGIESYAKEYDFNMQLKDDVPESIFLKPNYFDDNHYKKYMNDFYLFDNAYSKDFITYQFSGLNTLKIMKVIKQFEVNTSETPHFDIKEKQYTENYMEQSKKALAKRFLL